MATPNFSKINVSLNKSESCRLSGDADEKCGSIPPILFNVLSGFVSRFDGVHDSSLMDLSIFEYLHVSCDITLSTLSSPTSQIFDMDDEIVQHGSHDDSSSVSDPGPIDQRV